MAQKFKNMGIIPGDTFMSDPGGHGGYAAVIPQPKQNGILDAVLDKLGAIGLNSTGSCSNGREKHEPIILVGHSRGAATIQQVLGELYRKSPDIRVDLVVTIGLIPGIPFDSRPSVDLSIKQPNVYRHINIQSQAGQLFGGPTDGGLINVAPNEWNIAGADLEKTIPGTDHNSIDDETFTPTCTIPSEQNNPAMCKKSESSAPWDPAYVPVDNVRPIKN